MPSSSKSTAERAAIREIVRAKADREIARLLRRSYRLLNLHRRRRSTISNRERWQNYELRLLGRIRDEELAKLLRRGVGVIAYKRYDPTACRSARSVVLSRAVRSIAGVFTVAATRSESARGCAEGGRR